MGVLPTAFFVSSFAAMGTNRGVQRESVVSIVALRAESYYAFRQSGSIMPHQCNTLPDSSPAAGSQSVRRSVAAAPSSLGGPVQRPGRMFSYLILVGARAGVVGAR